VTLPTNSIVVRQQQDPALPRSLVSEKQSRYAKRAALKLIGLGLLLVLLYLTMYPLLIEVGNKPLNQAYYAKFPWLPHLLLTSWSSFLVQSLHLISIFAQSSGDSSTTIVNGYRNLLLALFVIAFVLTIVASRVGTKVASERLTSKDRSLLFWTVCLFTGAFGVIFIFAPRVMSQDIFLYAASVANNLFGFRLLGFIFYMANAMLIWVILAKLKTEMRISGVILFAWNPLVLLLGVSEAHYEIVVITFLLLGTLLFQHRSFLLSLVFLLLAIFLDVFCILLFPFFLKLLWKETQVMRDGQRFLWWLALISFSIVIVVLAFAPYARGWGLMGIALHLGGTFLEGNAVHSLDAAIVYLPMGFPLFLSWLSAPNHWMILVGITIGSLLLFGLWLVETLELVLLFSSWIFLGLAVLLPVHWPWFVLLPLALAIVSTSRYTILLAILLTLGATLEYYFLLWPKVWPNLALVTIGLPLLIWGWTLYFTATWLMARPKETE
jgi:hypothetical protein